MKNLCASWFDGGDFNSKHYAKMTTIMALCRSGFVQQFLQQFDTNLSQRSIYQGYFLELDLMLAGGVGIRMPVSCGYDGIAPPAPKTVRDRYYKTMRLVVRPSP